MTFKVFYTSLLLIIILLSCKKDTKITEEIPVPEQETITKNYAKLAVGNYWIYQRFRIDTSGIVTPTNTFDSCYISSQFIGNGNTYYVMYRPNSYGTLYFHLRDSAGWILNTSSQVQFSPTDFSSIFRTGYSGASPTDTIAKAINKMTGKDSIVNTPAGTFITSNSQWIHYMYPTWQYYGKIRRANTCYAENIGIVVETLNIIYTDPYTYERRLIRYHVN